MKVLLEAANMKPPGEFFLFCGAFAFSKKNYALCVGFDRQLKRKMADKLVFCSQLPVVFCVKRRQTFHKPGPHFLPGIFDLKKFIKRCRFYSAMEIWIYFSYPKFCRILKSCALSRTTK